MPLPEFNSVTASARVIPPRRQLTPKYATWQEEVWDYYDRLGEFESGVSWLANTLSRVRLLAAEISPGGDEPEIIETGPAAEAIERLAGGTAGQAQLMRQFTLHLAVPGEGWLVGEAPEGAHPQKGSALTGEERWAVHSADELRVARQRVNGRETFEVREAEGDSTWRRMSPDSLVVRVWDPHPRYGWQADSAARHSRGAMMKLDLINKRIIATILSRLASNGIMLYDKSRLSIPPRESPEDGTEVDPFAELLVSVASRGIKDPTSPEAVIPIPIGFTLQGELGNVNPDLLLRVINFSSDVDAALVTQRESAIRELATSLDMPAEVMLGMGDLNHWSSWQIEESGLKIHVAPKAELICYCLTTGYLIPSLKAMGADLTGPNGGKIVAWYDPSELAVRPDKSANVVLAYDRLEASGDALRREVGLDDGDKPDKAELESMVLKAIVKQAQLAPAAYLGLTGKQLPAGAEPAAPAEGEAPQPPTEEDTSSTAGPPKTEDETPPPPGETPPAKPGKTAQPAAASIISSLDNLSNEDAIALWTALGERLARLPVEPVSPWIRAGEPETVPDVSRRGRTRQREREE